MAVYVSVQAGGIMKLHRYVPAFAAVFLWFISYFAWQATDSDRAWIVMHGYTSALCVIAYLEAR